MPEASVIIPSYNRADLIGQAIASVLAQTQPDFELIVVDDGSTDNTGEIVKHYQDRRLHYLYQDNAGVSAARNRGTANSTGKYLCFLDSDDELSPTKLAAQSAWLNAHPGVGMVVSGYQVINREGQVLAAVAPWRSHPRLDLATLLLSCPLVPHAIMVRRSWYDQVGGFSTSLSGAADHDLWLRLAYAGCQIEWTRSLLCRYRIHGNNMSGNAEGQERDHLLRVEHFWGQPGLPQEIQAQRSKAYAMAYLAGAARKYGTGQNQSARASLERAIELLPELAHGDDPPLASALIAWAADPVTGDPAAFMANVFSQLPEAAWCLHPLQRRMMCAAIIRAAVEANLVGNVGLARHYLLGGLAQEPAIRNNPELVIELLVDQVRSQPVEEQVECLEAFFQNLPPELAGLRSWRGKALGRAYMSQGFQAYQAGSLREASAAVRRGVRHDPAWLRNRGIWAILVRSLVRTGQPSPEINRHAES